MFGWCIVFYIFLAGVAAGAFLCGVGVHVVEGTSALLERGSRSLRPAGAGFLLAAVLFPLACVFLFCDIGKPEAILAIFMNPLRNIVSLGGCVLALASGVSILLGFLLVTGKLSRVSLLALEIPGAILSLGVLLYTGLLLSSMPSVDFWRIWLLVSLFVLSGGTCGVAATCLLGMALGGSYRRMDILERIRGALAVIELVVLAVYLLNRFFASAGAQASVMRLVAGDCSAAFIGGVILVGIVAPAVCSLLRRVLDAKSMVLGSCGCTLLGGVALRWCVIAAAVVDALAFGGLFE